MDVRWRKGGRKRVRPPLVRSTIGGNGGKRKGRRMSGWGDHRERESEREAPRSERGGAEGGMGREEEKEGAKGQSGGWGADAEWIGGWGVDRRLFGRRTARGRCESVRGDVTGSV